MCAGSAGDSSPWASGGWATSSLLELVEPETMEARLRILFAAALVLAAPSVVAAQVTINPKVGVSLSDMKDATDGVDTKGRLGYQVGVDLRLGTMLYLQPGFYYQQTGLEQSSNTSGSYNLDVRGLHIPVLVGVRAGLGLAGIRVVAGPALTVVRSVKDNDGGVVKADLKERRLGGMAGVGVDILSFTIDLSGEIGLTNFFETGSSQKLRTIRLSGGVRF
jgi:hypothetical protein